MQVVKDKWIGQAKDLMSMTFKDVNPVDIEEFLNKKFTDNFTDATVIAYNNYEDDKRETLLSSVVSFIEDKKPILTESGALFKRHSLARNVEGIVIQSKLDNRKIKKKEKFAYAALIEKAKTDSSIDAETLAKYKRGMVSAELAQLRLKITVNSIYGLTGMPSSFLYNFASSSATTAKAQSLISIATSSFENFMADAVDFLDMDECLIYIKNILGEVPKYDISKFVHSSILKDITEDKVFDRLYKKFEDKDTCDERTLRDILSGLPHSTLCRLYYKNKFYEFINDSWYVQNLLQYILQNSLHFNNVDAPPASIKLELNELTEIMADVVLYNHLVFDSRYRLKCKTRYNVRVVDTDSNVSDVYRFIKLCDELIARPAPERIVGNKIALYPSYSCIDDIDAHKEKNHDDLAPAMVIGSIIARVGNEIMTVFLDACNVERDAPGTINLKFEYHCLRLLLTHAKKHYMSLYNYQEGKYFPSLKVDTKGMEYTKRSFASPETTKIISDIVEYDILKSEMPDEIVILDKVNNFSDNIRNSIINGEFTYLKEVKVKSMDSYPNNPWTNVRLAASVWDYVYPDKKFVCPSRGFLIKLGEQRLKDLAPLATSHPEVFERLEQLFKDGKLVHIKSICIPIGEDIPEWVKPYMDVNQIVMDTKKLVNPILSALSFRPVFKSKTAGMHYVGHINL